MRPFFSALFAALASIPLLAVAHLEYGHQHAHREVHGRAIKTEVVVVTETVYTTVTAAPSLSAAANLPQWSVFNISSKSAASTTSRTASPSVALPLEPSKAPDNPYSALIPQPNNAIVVNSCNYDVYVSSIGDESCGPGNMSYRVPPNSTYIEPIRKCYKSGIALKVCKTQELKKPMQFEYTVWDDKKTVSYDISYLDCMVERDGFKDFTQCVGHERGIQATAGKNCPAFHCLAEIECGLHAYTVPEFGYMPGAPVGACDVEKGVAFELCAENRA
ncbi:FAD-binding-like protein [Curvularia clavata]|uniref:FAD-binding-like protein n=1 Tax=Curvularia clavata TaxID=95742 RepID=A0A9Q9DVA4_CURCL|nr:FAD-binding-like protein [Curvularia clavata]